MNVQGFEHACLLKEQGKLRESSEEFIKIADTAGDPVDKASALVYAAAALKMFGEFEKAKVQLICIGEILVNLSASGKNTSVDERTTWLEIAFGFTDADIDRLEGRADDALSKFQHLLSRFSTQLRQGEYHSDYEMIQTRRAFILADLGRWNEALPILEEAESFEPESGLDGWLDFYLGHCYIAFDDYTRGEQRLRKSLKVGLPPHLEYRAHYALGQAYYEIGQYAHAKVELEKAAGTADPSYIRQTQLWRWLQATCQRLGLKEEAEHYAQLARAS